MSIYETTCGKAHTTDADYAKFSGQLVMTVSSTFYDPQRKCWIKRTCEYIDVGRPDPIEPDPDRQLMRERFPQKFQSNVNYESAKAANLAAGAARRAAMRDKVADYMMRYGAKATSVIARDLGFVKGVVYEMLTLFEGETFCRVGKLPNGGKTIIWGLVGVHDK